MRLPWSESSDSVAYTIRPAGRGHVVSLLPAASDLCVLCLEGPSEAVLAETLVPFQSGLELSDSDPMEA